MEMNEKNRERAVTRSADRGWRLRRTGELTFAFGVCIDIIRTV